MASKHNAEEVFNKAIELSDVTEQQEFLEQACAGNEKLRAEVDALLKWHEEAGDFLEVPPVDPDLTVQTSAVEGSGTVIGRYKLLEKVGEGGMATVYMAEQKRPIRRRVALKIIKLGMDTKQVIGRFEAERQALAMMDHPNIAKVLDAGTTETGRPYFVMELVRGLPITEFCDKKSLTTCERLELFISVCQAVQHAHQRGIIHRDIKPSNVLVTLHDGEPVAKVIDFGIAKAVNQQLTEKTVFTRYSQMIGTPEYMSPEQAEMSGLDIDTRTDVFSLGVLLYELLTGTTPFDSDYLLSKGYGEMQRIIREEEPTRPSTKVSTLGEALADVAKHRKTSPELLCKLIRTDLDWIVMKTLEKDRNRRYESVSEFSADIKRHLGDEPVLAGRPSRIYRMRKFVQRRRALVVAVSTVAIAVLVGFIVSTTMYVKAKRSAKREAAARGEAEAMVKFFTDDLLASVYPEKAKNSEVSVRYVMEAASRKLEHRFADRPRVEAEVRTALGLTYDKLGDYKAAEPHIKRAWEIRREQLGEDDPNSLAVLRHLGRLYVMMGRYEEAKPYLTEAIERQSHIFGKEHPDTLQSMCDLAELYTYSGYFDKGQPLATEALEIGRRILGEEHPIVLRAMQCCLWQYISAGATEKAEPLALKGYEISRRLLGEEHEDTVFFMILLSWVYGDQGRASEAIPIVREAMEISERILGEDHWKTIQAASSLGSLYAGQGRYHEAETLLTNSVEASRRTMGDGHISTLICAVQLARFYESQERYDEMGVLLMDALIAGRRRLDADHTVVYYIHAKLLERIAHLRSVARELYDAGRCTDALGTLGKQARLRGCLSGDEAELAPEEVALFAMCRRKLGHDQEATMTLQRLREMYERGGQRYAGRYLSEAEKCFVDPDSQTYQIWDLIEKNALQDASAALRTLEESRGDDGLSSSTGTESIRGALARAYCAHGTDAENQSQYKNAVSAYEKALEENAECAYAHDRLALLLATSPNREVRNVEGGVVHATKACELASWTNSSYLTTLATAHAEAGDFQNALIRQREAIDVHKKNKGKTVPREYLSRVHCYESGKTYRRTMVARWDFEESDDETVKDSSGNDLHGRLVGDAEIVTDPGRDGKVLSLDGSGDWVDCGRDPKLDVASEITIVCWAKVRRFDKRFHTLVSKGDNAWRLARSNATDMIEFACSGLTGIGGRYGAMYGALPGTTNVNDGQWHQLVGIYDGARICLYVDGNLDVSSEAQGSINTNTWNVLIGANHQTSVTSGETRSFCGLIDDVRIYDYALSEAEIKGLYASQNASPTVK